MSRSCKFGLQSRVKKTRIADTDDHMAPKAKGNFKGHIHNVASLYLPAQVSLSRGPFCLSPACHRICYQIVQFVQLVGCLPGGILKQLSNATWLLLLVVACLIWMVKRGRYTENKNNQVPQEKLINKTT